MLTYEKDVKPIKITAREAHKRSVGTEEDYIKLLIDVYNFIHEEVDNCNTSMDYWVDSLYLADRVFNELVTQGYNVKLEKDMGSDKVWHLSIDWEDVDLDPNTKYILLMDDTRNEFGQVCAILHHGQTSDSWTFKYVNNMSEAINFDYTVTAKDLEEAPDWVRAIEPVEVD